MKVIRYLILFSLLSTLAFAGDYTAAEPVTAITIEAAIADAYTNVATGPHNVIIPNGTHSNLGVIDVTAAQDGQSGKELTIKAETAGSVIMSGTSYFKIAGDYWIIQDLKFTALTESSGEKINIEVEGDNVRVTDNLWYDTGNASNEYIYGVYVEESADNVEIDHNKFSNVLFRPILIDNIAGDTSLNPHIHHNYFYDVADGHAGQVSIYLNGVLDTSSDNEMGATVEYNVFEECTGGSAEQVLLKNSNNTVKYNVFKNSRQISLRHGDDNFVFNNWAFGEPTHAAQFLQINGANHKIINNYTSGLVQYDGAATKLISIQDADSVHERVENLLIEGNTFIFDYHNTNALLAFTPDDGDSPTGVIIKSNIFHSNGTRLFRDMTSGACSVTWTDNLAYTTGDYFTGDGCGGSWPADTSNLDQLTEAQFNGLFTTRATADYGNIYVLDSSNEAIDNSTRNASYTDDFDGQARSDPCDTGCDEYSTDSRTIEPTSIGCVGPTWAVGYSCNQITGASPTGSGIGLDTDLNWTNPISATGINHS